MKKRVCRIVGWALLCVLIFTACGTNNIEQVAPQGSVLDNPSGQKEIVIETVYASKNWLPVAAQKFEEKTGVKVKIIDRFEDIEYNWVEVPDDSVQGYTVVEVLPYADESKYVESATTGMITGSGADIYDVNPLDFANLGKNGLLYDLAEWIDNDPNMTQDKVFRDILVSARTEDGLFAVPVQINVPTLCAASDSSPKLEYMQMNWKEFFDKAKSFTLPNIAIGESDISIFISRFLARNEEFIDEKNKTQTLASPEMITLLEESKMWRDERLCRDSRNLDTFIMPYSYQNAYWSSSKVAHILCDLPNNEIDNVQVLAPAISDMDKDEDIRTMMLYGVNANSPNKEIAVEFLQYLLSYEAQTLMILDDSSSDADGIAINRQAFRQQVEDNLKEIQKDEPDLKVYDDKEKYIAEAEAKIDSVDKMIIERSYYRELIYEVAKEYFLDKITAEEAAQRMADKVGLYLKEQG